MPFNRRFGVHGETACSTLRKRAALRPRVRARPNRSSSGSRHALKIFVQGHRRMSLRFLTELEAQLQVRYEEYLKVVGAQVRDLVERVFGASRRVERFLAVQAIAQWGKGPGYWDRPCQMTTNKVSMAFRSKCRGNRQ